MRVTEFPIDQLGNYREQFPMLAARQVIQSSVLLRIEPERFDQSIFSGFDGVCVAEHTYMPIADHIGRGILFGSLAQDWIDASSGEASILADVSGYALGTFCDTGLTKAPAVGVYSQDHFERLSKLHWRTKGSLSVLDACTDIFVWR